MLIGVVSNHLSVDGGQNKLGRPAISNLYLSAFYKPPPFPILLVKLLLVLLLRKLILKAGIYRRT